ncbi:MAG TPA: M14 family zinc carboxypeptidase [Candidatus Hydrogenedentes bacterium]|nr:M14 family zinc carboxypeptidase [Candidatus Hydrogenedentota bacterium]HPG69480.1 M14 family zinc carboxypeptidase [Candidatus Hydrogenedentota bacterium]
MAFRTALILGFVTAAGFMAVAEEAEYDSRHPDNAITYAAAKERIPARTLPAFWVADIDRLDALLAQVREGCVRDIARSPGGRRVRLVTYGAREPMEPKANFNSAVGAGTPAAFMDKDARQQPVILLLGPVHGQEVEGLVGLASLIHVMETGTDFLGRDQLRLRELGRRCRLLIIPTGNPDGVARFEPRALHGMTYDDLCFWGQGTWSDGTPCGWPECKQLHPMVGDRVGFLGCYFNDAGVNPMQDEFFAPMSEEVKAFLALAREEGPDFAVSLHSFAHEPTPLRPTYVPRYTQENIRAFTQAYYRVLEEHGQPHGEVFTAQAEGGDPPPSFNLISALYHISGAAGFVFECPHGLEGKEWCAVTLEQILDIQLWLYEALLKYALDQREGRTHQP